MALLKKLKSLLDGGNVDVLARFQRTREAVTGTMSKFYMARDRQTGKIVGLKILDPKKTAEAAARIKGAVKPSEGEIATAIKHPRIAETFEYGTTTKGAPYLVMEYVEGTVLSGLILNRSETLVGKRVNLIRQMAEAIGAVHEAGYIHRDVCPRNFICAPDANSLKLIDFGLTVPATRQFMQPGNRTGTPNYMAPEIARRRPTDHRVDIFALGVSAYQLLTFELPWRNADASGKAALAHDTVPPTDILEYRPDLDPALADAITRCLARDPDDRPASTEEFLQSIREVD